MLLFFDFLCVENPSRKHAVSTHCLVQSIGSAACHYCVVVLHARCRSFDPTCLQKLFTYGRSKAVMHVDQRS